MRASSITSSTTTTSHQYSGAAVAAAFSAFDPALLTVAHQVNQFFKFVNKIEYSISEELNFIFYDLQYAAAMNGSGGLFPIPQYPLNLAALAAAHNKNSSIADLRFKAKKHAEALGLKENTS